MQLQRPWYIQIACMHNAPRVVLCQHYAVRAAAPPCTTRLAPRDLLNQSTMCIPPCARVQELDEARASSKALREENTQLVNDNANLKQQLDSRSQHCMTLIGENKRLLGQVREAGQPRTVDAGPAGTPWSVPWVECSSSQQAAKR